MMGCRSEGVSVVAGATLPRRVDDVTENVPVVRVSSVSKSTDTGPTKL